MPPNVWELPPAILCDDPTDRCEDELLRIVPRDRRKPYNMRKLIELVVDRGSVFEIQPTFGKAVITALARLDGRVVGVIANNPMVYGGAIDVRGGTQADAFHRAVRLLPHSHRVPGRRTRIHGRQGRGGCRDAA